MDEDRLSMWTETVNPKNELNLLTDITVEPNNTEDSEILRADRILKREDP